jgi:hypothetical protein
MRPEPMSASTTPALLCIAAKWSKVLPSSSAQFKSRAEVLRMMYSIMNKGPDAISVLNIVSPRMLSALCMCVAVHVCVCSAEHKKSQRECHVL